MLPAILQTAKRTLIRIAAGSGISRQVLESNWRQSRLLILCYHGVSIADEHHWSPGMYVSPEVFEQRLTALQSFRCAVLPLAEAVNRLSSGTLPPRSVAITFDDGFYDFAAVAWPILAKFSFPATVYLTTYYVDRDWPVFDLMVSYLLWKARDRSLHWPEMIGADVRLDASGRLAADSALRGHAITASLSGAEKDQLLCKLAGRCAISLSELQQRRILHLMRPEEVSKVFASGADVQLHTHRHRVFNNRQRFGREIDENRGRIAAYTATQARHFCYPGGFTLPDFPAWLQEQGVVSATTCNSGMAARTDNPLLLPRVLDTNLPQEDFNAWISGTAAFFPRRTVRPSETQLGIEPPVPEQ